MVDYMFAFAFALDDAYYDAACCAMMRHSMSLYALMCSHCAAVHRDCALFDYMMHRYCTFILHSSVLIFAVPISSVILQL